MTKRQTVIFNAVKVFILLEIKISAHISWFMYLIDSHAISTCNREQPQAKEIMAEAHDVVVTL